MFLTDEQTTDAIIKDINSLKEEINAQLKDFNNLCVKLQEKIDDLGEKIKGLKRSHPLPDCYGDRF